MEHRRHSVDSEAALLLLWPAVEAGVELLAARVGLKESRPRLLLSELYSLGWVSERHFAELEEAEDLRNTVARRVGVARVDADTVGRLAQIARRFADADFVPVDQMAEWFRSRYMDPANGVPYESREGGYIYFNGGPFDASDVLSERFPTALHDELDDARDEIEQDGDEWVRVEDYGSVASVPVPYVAGIGRAPTGPDGAPMFAAAPRRADRYPTRRHRSMTPAQPPVASVALWASFNHKDFYYSHRCLKNNCIITDWYS